MLPSITSELRAELSTRGVPYSVVYGPERVTQTVAARSHIVVERDRQGGDEIEPAPAKKRNPLWIYNRWIGGVVMVYARSLQAGATVAEHERVADKVVDQILVALRKIVAERRTMMRIASARLLSVQDIEERDLKTWPGVIYEIRMSIGRGVSDAAYDGEGAVEKAAGTDFTVDGTVLDTSDSPDPGLDLPGATTRAS